MAQNIIKTRIQNHYDTEANWTANDPVLLEGEVVYTSDEEKYGQYKVGDGVKKWSELEYSVTSPGGSDVTPMTYLTATLTKGKTVVSISDESIKEDSVVEIFTDIFGANPIDVEVTDGEITITFEVQSTNMNIKVRIS